MTNHRITMSKPHLRELWECQEVRQLLKGHPEGKTQSKQKNIKNIFEKPQCKAVDGMGPLSKLWNILKESKGAEEDTV